MSGAPSPVRKMWRSRPMLVLIKERGRITRRDLLDHARREGWVFYDVYGAQQVRMTLRGLRAGGVVAYDEKEVWSTGKPRQRRPMTGFCAPFEGRLKS